MQGLNVAVVSSLDLLAILTGHAKMNGLRTAAITTFHQAETGAPAGIARIVQAATAPNEGQRFLQGDLHEHTMEGESRERTSTGTDAAGNVFTEREAERSVLLEDGRSVYSQQSQQVATAVPFDQSVLLDAIGKCCSNGMEHTTVVNNKTMLHVDKVVMNERQERKKAIKNETIARKKDVEDMKDALLAQNELLETFRLQLLEQGAENNKRPRETSNECYRPPKNILSNKNKDSFGWTKMVKGVCNGCKGFASAEEAKLDMARFYAAAVLGASAGGSEGA